MLVKYKGELHYSERREKAWHDQHVVLRQKSEQHEESMREMQIKLD